MKKYKSIKFKERKISRGVRLKPSNDKKLVEYCKANGKTPSEMMDYLVETFIK